MNILKVKVKTAWPIIGTGLVEQAEQLSKRDTAVRARTDTAWPGQPATFTISRSPTMPSWEAVPGLLPSYSAQIQRYTKVVKYQRGTF